MGRRCSLHDLVCMEEAAKNDRARTRLTDHGWAQRLLREAGSDDCASGFRFELRFAYEASLAGLEPIYEYKTGVGSSSVDFRLDARRGAPPWNVELVSPSVSWAIEGATEAVDLGGMRIETVDLGLTGNPRNDEERLAKKMTPEHEMLRTITCIEKKAFDQQRNRPIKFPAPDGMMFNMILVDVRKYDGDGFPDRDHLRQVAFGQTKRPESLFMDPGSGQPIQGVWSAANERSGAKLLQERIHVLAFVHEEQFEDDEIREVTVFYANPHLDADLNTYPLRRPSGRSGLRRKNALWNDG